MRHPATPVLNALTFQPHPRRIEQTPARLGLDYAELSIPTADGETLHGWWVRAPRSIGHVLIAHGNGGTIGDRVPMFALLTEAGVGVVGVDYRGWVGVAPCRG